MIFNIGQSGRIRPNLVTLITTGSDIAGRSLFYALFLIKTHDMLVWPNDGIKSSPIFSKSCPKSSCTSFYFNGAIILINPKVNSYLGYFCLKNCPKKQFKSSPIWSHCDMRSPRPESKNCRDKELYFQSRLNNNSMIIDLNKL